MIDPKNLPVYQQKDKILDCLEKNQVIVVQSPTGSGKTTQIPVILYDAGYNKTGVIGVTQPRRIAALSVSDFISKQVKCNLGQLVGYKMRFDDKTSGWTEIKIMTDGILLQELKADRYLSKYSVIMVDEAHERSLNIDFILGLLKNILKERKDFKVIISSATINAQIFSEYFDDCPIVNIDTHIFPIELIYNPLPDKCDENLIYAEICNIVEKNIDEEIAGDILVFLSGEANIKNCINELEQRDFNEKLFIIPLYGRLSKEEQEKVFLETPTDKIKIVVSTNIAETSVTINNITTVIDSGLAKINFYNQDTFTSALIESKISKASADQRKGRAGRTAAGRCYRLYSEKDYNTRQKWTTEEIFRTDLSEVILRMADLDITDFENFDYISQPELRAILSGIETLEQLSAINSDRSLTKIGKMMVEFPLLPRHSRIIIESIYNYPEITENILIATAFLSTHSPFILPLNEEVDARFAHHKFDDEWGDFLSYLKIYNKFIDAKDRELFCKKNYFDIKVLKEIVNIKEQLSDILTEKNIPIGNKFDIKKYLICIATGLIQFVCIKTKTNVYKSMTSDRISIHPGSAMYKENPQYIVAGEIVRTSRTFARSVSKLEKNWIKEISKHLHNNLIKQKSNYTKPLFGDDINKNSKYAIIGNTQFKKINNKVSNDLLILDWDRYKKIRFNISQKEFKAISDLRGVITWKNFDIMQNEKLRNILIAALYFNVEKDFIDNYDKSIFFLKEKDKKIVYRLEDIMKLSKIKSKSNNLGFTMLNTDYKGKYWFSSTPKFIVALNDSISSLDTLIEDSYSICTKREADEINRVYRKLTILAKKF